VSIDFVPAGAVNGPSGGPQSIVAAVTGRSLENVHAVFDASHVGVEAADAAEPELVPSVDTPVFVLSESCWTPL